MKFFKKAITCLLVLSTLLPCLTLLACKEEKKEELPEIEYTINDSDMENYKATDAVFSVANVTKKENSPLEGKTIYWLGSSVTYGSAASGESMADFLSALTGCVSKKDAVSGTTIFDDGKSSDTGEKSYTRRLVNSTVFEKNEKVDAFICQISTNDARNDRLAKWGSVTDDTVIDKDAFDRTTTLGGMEFIIAYVTETWDCPIYFYSGSRFEDSGTRKNTNPKGSNYSLLIDEVKKIVEKWDDYPCYDVGIIDLYNDADFNARVSDEYYKWATSDPIHPRRAGYLNWWTPYFENYLTIHLVLNPKNRI